MSKRLFVGNLPTETTEGELSEVVRPYGEILSVTIPMDRETGKGRGFGFVEVEDEVLAGAITGLNGTSLSGHTLAVSEAKPRTDRTTGQRR